MANATALMGCTKNVLNAMDINTVINQILLFTTPKVVPYSARTTEHEKITVIAKNLMKYQKNKCLTS